MATHSSILAWRTSWTEQPGGLFMWSQRIGHSWVTNTFKTTDSPCATTGHSDQISEQPTHTHSCFWVTAPRVGSWLNCAFVFPTYLSVFFLIVFLLDQCSTNLQVVLRIFIYGFVVLLCSWDKNSSGYFPFSTLISPMYGDFSLC